MYRENNADTSKQIAEQCKMVLLNGLMDNDDELRHNVFRFLKLLIQLITKTELFIFYFYQLDFGLMIKDYH